MRTSTWILIAAAAALLVAGCDDTESDPTTDTGQTGDTGTAGDTSADTDTAQAGAALDVALLSAVTLTSATEVDCTLETGAAASCHRLEFSSDIDYTQGPYCPPTIDDIGGLGIYDGTTNPGFQVMKAELFNAMEADGYDIVDADGTIRVLDPAGMTMPAAGESYCLEAGFDTALTLVWLVPVEPVLLSEPNTIDIVEKFGLALDGTPLTGHPPSATEGPPGMMGPSGSAMIPALDPCGGHPDPAGYFHWHFVPQSMNGVLGALGITDVSCANVPQDDTALVGFALDGFPVYAAADADGSLPADLDACNGHSAATTEHPEGIYHYHALREEAPNMPPCLMGASASGNFTLE